MAVHATEQAAEEVTRLIPFVGWLAAGSLSFIGTYCFLKQSLKELENVALLVLEEALNFDNFATD